MNVEDVKLYIKKQTVFNLEDIFDPLADKRVVWKKRRFTNKTGKLELMEICGEKARVAAYIFYRFYDDKRPKLIVVKDEKVVLHLKSVNCLEYVARGLENTSLAQLPDFKRKNLRSAIKRLIKENTKKNDK